LGHDESGALLGYVVELEVKGYDPTTKLSLVVGLKPDLSVSGVEILRDKETPGLGKKASEKRKPDEKKTEKPVWLDQFEGLSGEEIHLKKTHPEKGKVDAITASTITSQAVVEGVRQAVVLVKNLRAEGLLPNLAKQ
jgi:electron transport complex protein RnfG